MKPQKIKSKRQKLFRNTIYGIVSWLFPIIPTFVITPIVIKTLGNELYGLYVIILGFTGYFFTLNVGKAATKYVAEYKASGQIEKISNAVSATLLFGLAVGSITTATLAIFARYFVGDVLQIDEPLQRTAIIALYLGCLNILVSMLGLTFQSILQGLQRFDAFMLITNATSVLLTVGTLAAVISGYGVIAMFSVSLAVSVISALVAMVLVKRLLPELHLRLRVGREPWSEVWRYGMSIMAYQLFGSALLLFERSWITRRFGPEALTFYVVPMTLAVYLQTFIASLVLAIFPVINEHLSERQILAELYKQATRLILIILAFAGISSAVGGRLFLELWLNREFAELSYELLLLQMVVFSVVSLSMLVWQIAESFRAASLTAAANFIWMTVSVPLMVYFSYEWQTLGVAYARLVGVAVYIPLIVYIEKRFLGGVFWFFWSALIVRVLGAMIAAGSVEYFLLGLMSHSWISLSLSVLIGGVTYLTFLYLFRLISTDEGLMLRDAIFGSRW